MWSETLKYMFHDVNTDIETVRLNTFLDIGIYNYIDRTGVINKDNYVICSVLPVKHANIDLVKVITERAYYIVNVSENICLMWSGGIDSTVAFYALLETGVAFTVLYTDKSIVEYPILGNMIINNVFKNIKHINIRNGYNVFKYVLDNPNATIVTGEIGDQIFGSNKSFDYCEKDNFSNILNIVSSDANIKNIYHYTYDSLLTILDEIEVQKMTFREWLWAINFIFKYQTVQLRTASFGVRVFGIKSNGCHFFDNSDFNSYAIANYKHNSAYIKPTDYKMVLKDFIFSCNGDMDYKNNKLKHRSLRKL